MWETIKSSHSRFKIHHLCIKRWNNSFSPIVGRHHRWSSCRNKYWKVYKVLDIYEVRLSKRKYLEGNFARNAYHTTYSATSICMTYFVRLCERGYLRLELLSLYLIWFWTCFTTHAMPMKTRSWKPFTKINICTIEIYFICIIYLSRILHSLKCLLHSSPFSSVSARIRWNIKKWVKEYTKAGEENIEEMGPTSARTGSRIVSCRMDYQEM